MKKEKIEYSDKIPYKNELPLELQKRYKTENQWIYDGFILKKDVKPYKMYSGGDINNKVYNYYIDDDVEPYTKNNMPRFCLTCGYKGDANCRIRQSCSKRICKNYIPRKIKAKQK